MLQRLRRFFTYDDWANRETIGSLRQSGPPPSRSLGYLGHILAAERLWLDRLFNRPATMPVWPELTLENCETQFSTLNRAWRDFLATLSDAKLAERVSYTNSKGEPWSSSIEDILMHVVIHSAYHRAQIAADLRASGHAPAQTDFIHAVRQGFLG